MTEVTILTWPPFLGTVENHGAKIQYLADAVHYASPLLPPGTPIYTWSSQRHYADDYSTSTLPLLVGKQTYQITTALEATPDESIYLRVACYDRHNQLVKEYLLNQTGGTFEYPETAVRYDIQLITTTNQELTFKWLILGKKQLLKQLTPNIGPGYWRTALTVEQPTAIDIYVGRRNSGSWAIPITPDHAQLFLRQDDNYVDDPQQQANNLFPWISSFLTTDSQLATLPITIRASGYPEPELIQALTTLLHQYLQTQ